jgi:hypothetical protein
MTLQDSPMNPDQELFATYAQRLLTHLLADMAQPVQSPPARLLADLYADMQVCPAAYGLPEEPFVPFVARVELTEAESARHEALKAARLKARHAVVAYIQFLFDLAQLAEPAGSDLRLPRAEFERLAAGAARKAKCKGFLAALARCGLAFAPGDPAVVTYRGDPQLLPALAALGRACAGVKDNALFLFRRADPGVFSGKAGPAIDDALALVPPAYQASAAQTDRRLLALRFKREVWVDDGDVSYSLRYTRKGGLATYIVRIREQFQPELVHHFRWMFETDLTPRLLARLETDCPGLGSELFGALKPCRQCYGAPCMDTRQIEWAGQAKTVCGNTGWKAIGFAPADYQRLWAVLEAFATVV